MPEPDDHELLAEFARTESEAAFAALVARYVNLVYSTALRFAGNPHHAQEITQAVFIILARKAGKLSPRVVLSGWLYQTTRLMAANFMKGEIRRQHREQEAYMQSILTEPDSAAWQQLAPHLDEAMGRLGETDRNAIVLRFFENKTAREVGAALKLTEAAAHKRVNRALDKLRKIFSKRGVTLSGAIIAGAVSANSVQAAPVGLAKTISAVAVAKGAAASGLTLTLVKGALKIMAWTKAKTTIVVGAAILLAGGTTFVAVNKVRDAEGGYSWQVFDPSRASLVLSNAPPKATIVRRLPNGVPPNNLELASLILSNTPPQVTIVPTKFPKGGMVNGVHTWSWMVPFRNGTAIGMNCRADEIIIYAMGSPAKGTPSQARMVVEAQMATNCYDFIANLADGSREALKAEVEQKLGLIGIFESRLTDVLVLKMKTAAAGDDLRGAKIAGMGASQLWAASTSDLARSIEVFTRIPVVDETGLTNRFMLTLKWNEGDKLTGAEQLNLSLDKIGLELAPSRRSIEMLVVGRVKN